MKRNLILLAFVVACAVSGFACAQEKDAGNTEGVVKEVMTTDGIPELSTATEAMWAETKDEIPVPPQIDEAEIFGNASGNCLEKGIPIDTDEFMMFLLGDSKIKAKDISESFVGYLVCRQYVELGMEQRPGNFLTEPFFKKGVGTSVHEITEEQRKKADVAIQDLMNSKLQDLFILYMMMGEKKFLGKPLAEGGCSMVSEKRRAGCMKNVDIVMNAVAKGDDSACNGLNEVDLPGAGDMCTLLVSKDPDLCRVKGFMYPLPYELCVDFVTMSAALSGTVKETDKLQLQSNNLFMKTILDEIKNKDKCKTYFKENILPGFCEWRGNTEISDAAKQRNKQEEKIKAENEKLKQERKKEEEKKKKETE